MITDALIAVGYFLLSAFAAVLPDSDGLPVGFENALSDLFETAFKFDAILPIDTLLAVMTGLAAFELGLMVYKLTRWVFASVPFSNIKHK